MNVRTEYKHGVIITEFSIPTTGIHIDFIAELLNVFILPHSREALFIIISYLTASKISNP